MQRDRQFGNRDVSLKTRRLSLAPESALGPCSKILSSVRIAYVLLLISPISAVAQTCDILGPTTRLEGYIDEGLGASDDGSVIFGQVRKTGEIKLWNSNTGAIINVLKADGDTFDTGSKIVVSEKGQVLATMLKHRKNIWIGDTVSGQKITEFNTTPFRNTYKMKMSPDGRVLLAGDYFKGAALWDINGKRYIGRLDHPSLSDAFGKRYPFLKSAFSPDSKIIATSFWGYIYIWDSNSAKFIKRLYNERELASKPFEYNSFTYDLEFSPDGTLLAAAGRDGKTQLWELDSGELRASLKQGDRVFSAHFSGDGRFLATVSYDDRNIKVWDTNSGNLLYTVKGNKSSPFSVTFSKPETGLIAVPVKRTVEFRDVATGTLVQRCDNFFGYFLPRGASFLAGLGDRGMGLFTIRK